MTKPSLSVNNVIRKVSSARDMKRFLNGAPRKIPSRPNLLLQGQERVGLQNLPDLDCD